MKKWLRLSLPLAVMLTVSLVYASHFQNGFHFDDAHTVVDNPWIRDLSHIPEFYVDGATFSVLPANQSYRPLTSTTLAIDYALGGGLQPWAFHVGTFLLFLVQLGLMAWLFQGLLRRALGAERAWLFSWLTVWLYGLHPVGAETVNYIIQRADLHAALGLVAAMAIYVRCPGRRSQGFYLIPFGLSTLSKPTALVFPGLLLVYYVLYERSPGESPWRSIVAILPASVLTAALVALHKVMTPASYTLGGASPKSYLITQPYVIWTYFRAFFLPTELSADTDLQPFQSLGDPRVIWGFVFLLLLLTLIMLCARKPDSRPISYGILWFLLTLVPTSLAPLAEVTNDHRMFGPLIGLSLSLGCLGGLATRSATRWQGRVWLAALVLLLCLAGYGTWQRNLVWRTEESLWKDVVEKSPGNGRGWMNYGLSLMEQGKMPKALECFEQASALSSNYQTLEINLAIVKGALGRQAEAETHFQRALSLRDDSIARFFYGRWLNEQKRYSEAEFQWRQALKFNPADPRAWNGLADLLEGSGRWSDLRDLQPPIVVEREPAWIQRRNLAGKAEAEEEARWLAETAGSDDLDPWLGQSFFLYRAGRFPESLEAARRAAELEPRSARAHNNVAAALIKLELFEEAQVALRKAISLDPSLEIAKNNLAAITEKR